MKLRWSYLLFWTLLLALEVYIEFVWVYRSMEDTSLLVVIKIVLLTELSANLVRIPVAITLERIINRSRPLWTKVLFSTVVLMVGLILYRTNAVYFVLGVVYKAFPEQQDFFGLVYLNSNLLNLIFTSVVYIAFVQYHKARDMKTKAEQLRKENLENELKFLKAQLNPHFLFNTLNNLYGLARRQDKNTPDVILQLSELLRFMLYEANTDRISLEKELALLDKYMNLEKIRYDDRLEIVYQKSVQDPSFEITPLLIIHLVENAFKHGVSESIDQAFISIIIKQNDGKCFIEISNTKNPQSAKNADAIGMKNVKRQLDLTYSNYELDVSSDEHTYSLSLILPHSL